jgi:N-glycosylase/DNA lyase
MISEDITTAKVERTVIKVCEEIERNEKGDLSWEKIPEEALWYELVSCILGSRVRYELAKDCSKHLQNSGLLLITNMLKDPTGSKKSIAKELSMPIFPSHKRDKGTKYPFSNSKAGYIVKTCLEIYENRASSIRQILESCEDEYVARKVLVELCWGIGPKQASLFLRNIGYCDNLAILDSHILNFIDFMGLLKSEVYKGTMNSYLKFEEALRNYASSINKTLSSLDLAIWVVMRVIRGRHDQYN